MRIRGSRHASPNASHLAGGARRAIVAAITTTFALGALHVTSAVTGTTRSAHFMLTDSTYVRPFGDAAAWNRPVAGLPTSSNSANLVSHIWDGAPWPGEVKAYATAYTYPVYDFADATETVPVKVINTSWGSNLIGKTVPWNPSWQPSPGPDSQVIELDPATGREWDLWEVSFDGTTLTIGNGNLVPDDYRSDVAGFSPSRGAGIQYLAMLVRPQEVALGVIAHALAGPIVDVASSFVAPATKSDGGGGTVPMGTRFALNISDADIDAWLSTLPLTATGKASARVIAVALRDYGWFVVDNGGGPSVQFEDFKSSQSEWDALGLGSQTVNGKTYPHDLLDGLLTPSRVYALVPSNQYPAAPNSSTTSAPTTLTTTTASGPSTTTTTIPATVRVTTTVATATTSTTVPAPVPTPVPPRATTTSSSSTTTSTTVAPRCTKRYRWHHTGCS
jgi:hypothetical protein